MLYRQIKYSKQLKTSSNNLIARCPKCDMNDLVRLDEVVPVKPDK